MDQDESNQREWARPDNWRTRLGVYWSAGDTRVWVPKRNPRLGWTLNFAHGAAWWNLFGLLIVPLGLLLLLVIFGQAR